MATQIGFGPLQRIDGPPPIPPQYGLLPAAEAPAAGVRIVTDVDGDGIERWLNGVEVFPYPVDTGGIYDSCSTPADSKNFGGTLSKPEFSAMTAYLAETCTSYRVWNQDEYKARAVAVLEAVESFQIASEFMRGTKLLLNPHLADGNGTFPNGNIATSVFDGLALLEAEIAKSGRMGLIHCSPELLTVARERFVVDDRKGVVRTINGIPVVNDFGYQGGATPTGHSIATGSQQWMYASGPVDIRRSEVFTSPDRVDQALDRGTRSTTRPNSITYRAERFYLVDWDTAVQAAVLVDLCSTTCNRAT